MHIQKYIRASRFACDTARTVRTQHADEATALERDLFSITELPSRTYVFRANNENEKQRWIDVFNVARLTVSLTHASLCACGRACVMCAGRLPRQNRIDRSRTIRSAHAFGTIILCEIAQSNDSCTERCSHASSTQALSSCSSWDCCNSIAISRKTCAQTLQAAS
jgi:hypothetical protein